MGFWRFAGAFAVVERQSELKISEANAGAPDPLGTPECTSASLCHSVCWVLAVGQSYFLSMFYGFAFSLSCCHNSFVSFSIFFSPGPTFRRFFVSKKESDI